MFWLLLLDLFATPVNAACPVCIVAVGSGLMIAEWLGVDSLLAAIWIMGLSTAMGFWMAGWLDKKMKKSEGRGRAILTNGYLWAVVMLAMVLAYYYWADNFGYRTILGMDSLVLGSLLGMGFFMLAEWLEGDYLRKKNDGKAFFPYQKVVVPVGALVVATLLGMLFLEIF